MYDIAFHLSSVRILLRWHLCVADSEHIDRIRFTNEVGKTTPKVIGHGEPSRLKVCSLSAKRKQTVGIIT